MTSVIWSNRFKAIYKKRIAKNDQLVKDFLEAVDIFEADRTSPIINDHQLEDRMFNFRAFSINENYRVVYIDKGEVVIFMDIGTHEQVYKK